MPEYTKIFEAAAFVICVIVGGALLLKRFNPDREKIFTAAFWLITGVAVAARLWKFWEIPYGLNQDEASIGYDVFAIGFYGYDRNGFHLPIYPIGFGAGHGPLYTYLSIPAVRLFGLSIFSLRITNAALSCVAAITSYFLMKRLTNSRAAALIGFGLTATAPALIVSARWALDGCPPPSLFIIGMYLFIRAIEAQKTWFYGAVAAFFALICYTYGPVGIMVPIFLSVSSIYVIRLKKITFIQLIVCVFSFGIVLAPMAFFLIRNTLDLPAIHGFISFPKFTVMRTSDVLLEGFHPENFLEVLKRIIFQPQDLIWNTVPGFGTTYLFTAPLIVFGALALAARVKIKEYNHLFLVAAYCIAGFVMCGLISQNVNRISIVYPAVVMLITFAIDEIWRKKTVAGVVICLFVAISFTFFIKDYFGEKYKNDFGSAFFYSFGDALEFAMKQTDGTICVTERNQNVPSIITLFYSKLPPERFYNTVKYYDDTSEWRNAMYFDRFVFGTPEVKNPDTVYVVDISEIPDFDPKVFLCKEFTYYAVMY